MLHVVNKILCNIFFGMKLYVVSKKNLAKDHDTRIKTNSLPVSQSIRVKLQMAKKLMFQIQLITRHLLARRRFFFFCFTLIRFFSSSSLKDANFFLPFFDVTVAFRGLALSPSLRTRSIVSTTGKFTSYNTGPLSLLSCNWCYYMASKMNQILYCSAENYGL